MKIVLDLQACQGESRDRGIGRYSWALAQAMLRCGRDRHEFWVALNAAFAGSVESIRRELGGLLPPERIVAWKAKGPMEARVVENERRLERGLAVREAFLEALHPDFVHIASLFEGMSDDSLHSVPAALDAAPVAVTLYDLIPLLNRPQYLPNWIARDYYYRQLDSLRRARLLFAISESSRREALECLDWPEDRVVNISSAVESKFRHVELDAGAVSRLKQKFKLRLPFVMCAGVVEMRKNVDALIRAFASLPRDLRKAHQLVLVGKVGTDDDLRFRELMRKHGLASEAVVMTGFIEDDDLIDLYNLCKLFVFPSWHEGFGLPALEAMACGAPVIAAGTSSLPEVVGRADALFDPHDDAAITALMQKVLRDDALRASLAAHGVERAGLFSWDRTAQRALAAMEEAARRPLHESGRNRKPRLAYVPLTSANRTGLVPEYMDLIRALAAHYEIDLITDVPKIDPAVPEAWSIRSLRWFRSHIGVYDRVLYQAGELPCSDYEAAVLRHVPGTVLFHRIAPDRIADLVAAEPPDKEIMRRKLYRAWGYRGLIAAEGDVKWEDLLGRYPMIYADLENADGLIVMAGGSGEVVAWDPGERAAAAVHHLSFRPQHADSGEGAGIAQPRDSDAGVAARELRDAIERFHAASPHPVRQQALADLVSRTAGLMPEPGDVALAAQAIADAFPPILAQRQLLLDISRLVVTDAGSGIQRVVRSHLMALLRDPPPGFRVEPVYAIREEAFYRYARRYACGFLGVEPLAMPDDPLDVALGDVFLGLDLAADIVPGRKDYFLDLRRRGVSVHFVFYDALAGRHPEWFPEDLSMWMRRWYQTIAEVSDGVVAISRSSAEDLRDWLMENGLQRDRPLPISWAHIGADIGASVPSRGVDESIERAIRTWSGSQVFLMVGTVEPRKGQSQALDAFERLWAAGASERLVVVGRQGWRTEAFAQRLRSHPEFGKRLFWFSGITDEMLQALYAASSVLLAASFGEGFGLPLIEAAQHGLPILARDLPVFREVAGDAAVYFDAPDAEALAHAIVAWAARARKGDLPDVRRLQHLTWAESTARLLAAIEGKGPCIQWRPGEKKRANDPPPPERRIAV
ncbi:MAG TPA: glycosyltransferase family 1 protein [Rhodanobacteraceae bacterium]|nr:glycosyltransferase family 1 protein [Rhodanobacteraceae bacterium]